MEYKTKAELIKELENFIKDAEQYKSWQNKTCYKQFGSFDWYCLECKKLKLNDIKCKNSLQYEATNNGICLEYVEGDIILSFELLDYEKAQASNGKEFLEYSKNNDKIRIIDCAFSDDKQILFGCWLKDGKEWQVLGYAEQ